MSANAPATILALSEAGFTNAQVLSEDRNAVLVRVRTAKGWVYERFKNPSDVSAWAVHREPEAS